MTVTVSPYNHTARRFADGSNAAGDTYKVTLYSSFSFDATDTTRSDAESGGTQLSSGYGYTQDDYALSGVTISTVTTNDAAFDANDVQWTASGGAIGPARYALVWNDTDADDPPVFLIDFGENKTADSGTTFNINWPSGGIITWTVT